MFLRGQASKRTLEMKMIFKKNNGEKEKKMNEREEKNEEISCSVV